MAQFSLYISKLFVFRALVHYDIIMAVNIWSGRMFILTTRVCEANLIAVKFAFSEFLRISPNLII